MSLQILQVVPWPSDLPSRSHGRRKHRYHRSPSEASSCQSSSEDRRHLQKSEVQQVFGDLGKNEWRSPPASGTAPKYHSVLSAHSILSSKSGRNQLEEKQNGLILRRREEAPHDYDSGNDTSSPPSCKTAVSERKRGHAAAFPDKHKFTDNGSDSGNSVTSYASLCKTYRGDSLSTSVLSPGAKRADVPGLWTGGVGEIVLLSQKQEEVQVPPQQDPQPQIVHQLQTLTLHLALILQLIFPLPVLLLESVASRQLQGKFLQTQCRQIAGPKTNLNLQKVQRVTFTKETTETQVLLPHEEEKKRLAKPPGSTAHYQCQKAARPLLQTQPFVQPLQRIILEQPVLPESLPQRPLQGQP
uniref:Uncharacterized protein n=1 Tax=Knipowitschia caucasica TaxID=637954 RepID=A0AAV2MQF1_KNICA